MTTEDVIDRDSIPSPGGWTVPAGERAGWTWTPTYTRVAPERLPWWVRIWCRTPVIDRYAGTWMWPRGGYLVLPPDHPFFRAYGPDEYEAASGMPAREYEHEFLNDVRDALHREFDGGAVTVERVTLESEGADTRVVILFRLADRAGTQFGYEMNVWPSPHPDDYEGTPDWGWMMPEWISNAIAAPGRLDGEPDAQGVTWLREPID